MSSQSVDLLRHLNFFIALGVQVTQILIFSAHFSNICCLIADTGQCSGTGLMIYQISLYPSLQKACGTVRIALITGVSFHILQQLIQLSISLFFVLNIMLFGRLVQVLSIPLLQSYPFIAMLSGFLLNLVISIASVLKNILTVSASLCLFEKHLYFKVTPS